MMLQVVNLSGGYQKNKNVLSGVNFLLEKNDSLAVFGHNGSGKSTLGKAIMGLLPSIEGNIIYRNAEICKKTPDARVAMGIGYFWQDGRIFSHLSVLDNLRFAAGKMCFSVFEQRLEDVCNISARYKDMFTLNTKQPASYLSSGEKKLLFLAMLLIRQPELLILDEPSAGLSPAAVSDMYEVLLSIKQVRSVSILLIEQNLEKAIAFCNSCLILQNGTISFHGDLRLPTAYQDIEKIMFDN